MQNFDNYGLFKNNDPRVVEIRRNIMTKESNREKYQGVVENINLQS